MWLQEEEKQSRQEMERMTRLVQRMCNQNLQHDLISDFKACTAPCAHIRACCKGSSCLPTRDVASM